MKGRTGAFVLLALLAVVDSAFGQQIVTPEFSFSNPGARSMGLAGAFVALADDATAAYANPAGLVQLVEPEVSLEGRVWSYSTPFIVGGRADGVPTGIGLDTIPGLVEGESTADYSGLSFVSFVYPLSRWSLAFYAHRMAKFESSSSTQGLFADGSTFVGTDRWSDTPGSSSLEIITFGFSAGYRVIDSLSLGFGLLKGMSSCARFFYRATTRSISRLVWAWFSNPFKSTSASTFRISSTPPRSPACTGSEGCYSVFDLLDTACGGPLWASPGCHSG